MRTKAAQGGQQGDDETMFTVLVTDLKLGGTTPFGPYRSSQKAREVRDLFRNPQAVDYRDPDEYAVEVAALRKYGEV
jgi:hypothetical protein